MLIKIFAKIKHTIYQSNIIVVIYHKFIVNKICLYHVNTAIYKVDKILKINLHFYKHDEINILYL